MKICFSAALALKLALHLLPKLNCYLQDAALSYTSRADATWPKRKPRRPAVNWSRFGRVGLKPTRSRGSRQEEDLRILIKDLSRPDALRRPSRSHFQVNSLLDERLSRQVLLRMKRRLTLRRLRVGQVGREYSQCLETPASKALLSIEG
uniref:Uncharacterized protein n=1 Tax=Cannabis sativa TaxID=3483 RepID=A0A803NT48_CANSA